MGGERRFVISISGEDRGASETLRRTSREADKLGKSAKGATSSTGSLVGQLSGAVPGAAGAATGAIGDLVDGLEGGAKGATLFAGAGALASAAALKMAYDFTKSASAVQEQVSAAKQTFGASAKEIIDWSMTTDESVGIAQAAALQAANAFGGMFTNLGFTEQKSADMSRAAVQLAGDLASFKNLGVDDALAKIRSGLAGEIEPLRNVGVFLGENVVKSRAMADGLANAKGELSETAKVATRFQLILEQTTKAQGDAARTAGEFANAQRRAAAVTENAKATLGTGLLDYATDLQAGAAKAINWLDKLGGAGQAAIGGLAAASTAGIPGVNALASGLAALGDSEMGTLSTTEKLSEATRTYAKVVIDGKENTDAGRAAKAAYVAAVKAAEAETGRLGSAMETEAEAAERVKRELDEAKRATEEITKAQKHYADSLDTAEDSIFALSSAQRSMTEATEGVVDAERDVIEAQDDLNELRREGAVDAEEVARATKSLEGASRSLADAHEDEAEAVRDLADARKGASAFDLRGGEISVEEAGLAWQRASDRVREAEAALAKGREDGLFGPELNDLEMDLREARLADEKASRAVEEAERALVDMRQQGTAQDERVIDAEKGVTDARRRVKDATDARRTAEAELRAAQAGDPEFAEQLAKATDRVKAAQDGVVDARWRAVEAARALQDAEAKEQLALLATAGAAGEVGRRIDELVARHPQLAAVLGTVRALLVGSPDNYGVAPLVGVPGSGSSNLRPRAAGGDISDGHYLINEGAQTEILTKTSAGGRMRMTPVGDLGGANISLGGVTFEVHGVSDADALVRQVGPKLLDWLRREVKRSGPLGLESPLNR